VAAVVNTNLTGPFLCTQHAFRIMKDQTPRGGRIINNGSISAHAPRPFSAAYTSTKHAITGLTKASNLDGRSYDIAVGQVDIGNAATPMTDRMVDGVLQPDGRKMPEPRMDAKAVGDAVAYMATLPLDANVLFMTVMASKMPFVGGVDFEAPHPLGKSRFPWGTAPRSRCAKATGCAASGAIGCPNDRYRHCEQDLQSRLAARPDRAQPARHRFLQALMQQMIRECYPDQRVTFSVINRSRHVRLAEIIDEGELRAQLDHARTIRFAKKELIWLAGNTFYGKTHMFSPDFINWLATSASPNMSCARWQASTSCISMGRGRTRRCGKFRRSHSQRAALARR